METPRMQWTPCWWRANLINQRTQLPIPILNDIKDAACTPWLKIPDSSTPLQNFSTIQQGVCESFIKFIDRLQEAIEKQIDNSEAREELLGKMAATNVN